MNWNALPYMIPLWFVLIFSIGSRSNRYETTLLCKDGATLEVEISAALILVQKEFERSREHKYAMCAVMIGIDHFKKVNDQYGHTVGDQAMYRAKQTGRNRVSIYE